MSRIHSTRIYANIDAPWRDSIGIHIVQFTGEEHRPMRSIAKPLEFTEPVSDDALTAFEPEPSLRLCVRDGSAQQLMDELWRCGIRPTEGQGSAGQLAAVEAHLKDALEVRNKVIEKLFA